MCVFVGGDSFLVVCFGGGCFLLLFFGGWLCVCLSDFFFIDFILCTVGCVFFFWGGGGRRGYVLGDQLDEG